MLTSNFSRNQVSDVRFLVDESNFDGENWLISIRDSDAQTVQIKLPMDKVLHVAFDDISLPFAGSITTQQAAMMADFIRLAKARKVNLWVNCHAGVCRSGAVVEILKHLGWTINEQIRSRQRVPNVLVYNKLREQFSNVDIPEMRPIIEYIGGDQIIYP